MKDLFSFRVRTVTLRVCVLALLALGSMVSDRVQAQNSSELAATYGRGVHAYFANQTDLAEQYFSQVIEAGSTDPRVLYFRAMTRMRSGRQHEAQEDMRAGATFEARDPGNRHAVGKALERVQGPHRLTLEGYRQQARMDRLQQRRQQTRDRYEQLQQREPAVLRREMPVPLEDLVEPSLELPGAKGAKPTLEVPQPAGEPGGVQRDPAPARSVPPQEPEDDDPFGNAVPANDDIFSEPQEPAAESETPEEPADSTEPAPAEDDPSSEPVPAEEPADEEDPFAVVPPSTDSESDAADLAEDAAPAEDVQLTESDRIDAGQLMGVLGRVVVSVFPWRGLELPALGPEPGADEFMTEVEPADAELGPADEASATVPVSAEEPIEAEDESEDPFGESADDSTEQPADDLFGESADDPFGGGASADEAPEATPKAGEEEHTESKETEPASEDPFGEF